jgi:hypothetical protein
MTQLRVSNGDDNRLHVGVGHATTLNPLGNVARITIESAILNAYKSA